MRWARDVSYLCGLKRYGLPGQSSRIVLPRGTGSPPLRLGCFTPTFPIPYPYAEVALRMPLAMHIVRTQWSVHTQLSTVLY